MNALLPFSAEYLWTPDQPLPDRPVLHAIAEHYALRWGCTDEFKGVWVGYNRRLRTTLGRAVLDGGRVELNPHLLRRHRDQVVPTLVHELAHVVVYRRHGQVAPHGRQFRRLMKMVGLSPAATHDLPVRDLRRRRYLYLHRCRSCGQTFVARKPCWSYYCRTCGPDMKWVVHRAPDTAEGRKLIARAD